MSTFLTWAGPVIVTTALASLFTVLVVGRLHRRKRRAEMILIDRIAGLTQMLDDMHKRLVREEFEGVNKAGAQLWRIHCELERLGFWLEFLTSDDRARRELVNKLNLLHPMKIDRVFLHHITQSDGLFNADVRQVSREILAERTRSDLEEGTP